MKNILLLALLIGLLGCDSSAPDKNELTTEDLTDQLNTLTETAINNISSYPLDSTKIPRSLNENGGIRGSGSRDWTSGFYAGTLWSLYRFSGKEPLKAAAMDWTAYQEKEKLDTHTHDLGFKIYCSFGEGFEITQSPDYKDVIVKASETLIKRYNPTVGAIRSWDWNRDVWQFPVIIDNMMNLELLFELTKLTGDSTYYNVAISHANTTIKNHFREDNSSYHVVDYDDEDGKIRKKMTAQGFADESAWARGQSWGLYGYTVAYRYTKDPAYLKQAEKIAEFILEHPNLPEDLIPYWDFNAPNIPEEPRDASAAAITASALIELDQYTEKDYLGLAKKILKSLSSSDYLLSHQVENNFLLAHSTGNKPGNMEIDVPLVYADYYFMEALLRLNELGDEAENLTVNN